MAEIGSMIDGKYQIISEIGRGGMSVVYLAMDIRLNKCWAVKELRKLEGTGGEVAAQSLLAESQIMKNFDHPALPRIVDIINCGETVYVVMDYIEGKSLDKVLEESGPQPEESVALWVEQLVEALDYLHTQSPPIIYRDVKPANIMLTPMGSIKLIDFGIARKYKEQANCDTVMLGTRGYAPPEQYNGRTDPRSDIFALGMTMHHLLTGVDPRSGQPYKQAKEWKPDISGDMNAIIEKCVRLAPEERYQNCGELIAALKHQRDCSGVHLQTRKRKLAVLAATLGVCLCVAAVCVIGAAFGESPDGGANGPSGETGNSNITTSTEGTQSTQLPPQSFEPPHTSTAQEDESAQSQPTGGNGQKPPADQQQTSTSPNTGKNEISGNTKVRLQLNRADLTLVHKGDTWKLYDGDIPIKHITWTSDDEKIVIIKDGIVTAVGTGNTKVHAEYNGKKVSCTVRCGPAVGKIEESGSETETTKTTAASYNINETDVTICVGETFTLKLLDTNDVAVEVVWFASDASICSVSGNIITGLKVGKTTVSVTYEGEIYSCIVRVTDNSPIDFDDLLLDVYNFGQ